MVEGFHPQMILMDVLLLAVIGAVAAEIENLKPDLWIFTPLEPFSIEKRLICILI